MHDDVPLCCRARRQLVFRMAAEWAHCSWDATPYEPRAGGTWRRWGRSRAASRSPFSDRCVLVARRPVAWVAREGPPDQLACFLSHPDGVHRPPCL